MMALSVRHSPYTIPSPRFNSMASPTTYNPHFSSGGAGGIHAGAVVPPPGPATSYNIPSSSMLGLQPSMFSSMSPLATCGTTLQGSLNPSMNLLPTVSNILCSIMLYLLETHVWSNSHCIHKLVENWLFSADSNMIGLSMPHNVFSAAGTEFKQFVCCCWQQWACHGLSLRQQCTRSFPS